MSDTLTTRLEQVEMTLAHQDKTIEDLNAVVLAHREEIDRLTRRLNKMHGRMEELEEFMPAPEAKKPPHW